jgi:two-component system, NarL family, nitrate/nitrite response regulator NarL
MRAGAQTKMSQIRLLLLDDHTLFRESLSRLIESEPDFEIKANCGTIPAALEALSRETVDLVLLDFELGTDHGNRFISLARAAGYQGRILIVTAGMNQAESATALKLGASGIFFKHDSPAALAQAIRVTASGGTWLDQRLVQAIASNTSQREQNAVRVTEREEKVLQSIFEGLSNKEIAARLGVSESAVKASLQQLFAKTNVRTRSQLVRVALEGALGPSVRPQ